MVLLSGLLVYWEVIAPLISASRHVEDIVIEWKFIIFIPVLSNIGLIYVIMGKKAQSLMGRHFIVAGIIIFSLFLGSCLYYWLWNRLNQYGYFH